MKERKMSGCPAWPKQVQMTARVNNSVYVYVCVRGGGDAGCVCGGREMIRFGASVVGVAPIRLLKLPVESRSPLNVDAVRSSRSRQK